MITFLKLLNLFLTLLADIMQNTPKSHVNNETAWSGQVDLSSPASTGNPLLIIRQALSVQTQIVINRIIYQVLPL